MSNALIARRTLNGKIKCEVCGVLIISLSRAIGGRISICPRSKCRNHYVVFEDLDTTIRKFYKDDGYW